MKKAFGKFFLNNASDRNLGVLNTKTLGTVSTSSTTDPRKTLAENLWTTRKGNIW